MPVSGTRLMHRAARTPLPEPPQGRVIVAGPPTIPPSNTGNAVMMLVLPLLSTIAMAGYMISFGRPWMVVAGVAFVVLSIAVTVGARYQMTTAARRQRLRQQQRYHGHLVEVRRKARVIAARQRESMTAFHPSPQRLLAIVEHGRRLWERRRGDQDFLVVRLGTGRSGLSVQLEMAQSTDPMTELDPEMSAAATELMSRADSVGRQPALVDLRSAGVVTVIGPAPATRGVGRAALCQVAALQAPDDVAVMVCAPGASADWQWATWLPHVRNGGPDPEGATADLTEESRPQDADPPIAVTADPRVLTELLEPWLARARRAGAAGPVIGGVRREPDPGRRLVVLLDGYDPGQDWVRDPGLVELMQRAGSETGISVICLAASTATQPPRVDVRVHVDDHGRLRLAGDSAMFAGVEDGVSDAPGPALAGCIGRAMAGIRLRRPTAARLVESISVPRLLGLSSEEVVSTDRWLPPQSPDLLRVPLGLDSDGVPLVLDLKESAQGGVGPHGLIIGATGSGKSELLRTLVVGLAMTHPPELLSFVLVDFKGGATFASATQLPHVAGLITNLADDTALVDRVRAALQGEQQRRQKMLRDAGNVDSVREYQMRQASGGTDVNGDRLQPLPYLLVIVDEFGELLADRPDFIELFVQIGRVGRSLGIHLLLASQRLDEGRLRGLESHLSYRLCLRTFSAAESRAVIGVTDAYLLPSLPGSAYLKVDESVFRRFRVSHVSGPAWPPAPEPSERDNSWSEPVPFTLRTLEQRAPEPGPDATARLQPSAGPVAARPAQGPSTMELVVDALSRQGTLAHQVWLPPLPAEIGLGAVLGPMTDVPGRGMQTATWPWPGSLRVPLGVLDEPVTQKQNPLVIDFAAAGNLALVGAPQTGKSTLIRTALLSFMLTHTPEEAQFAGLDFGGGGLRGLADAPHVAGVAGRRDVELARRVLLDTRRLVDDREREFAELGIDSAAEWRRRRSAGTLPAGIRAADLFLVLDNWPAIRADLDLADELVVDVAARGLGVGVHLIVTANRWIDVRVNLRDSISSRLELRLNDPSESEISRPVARSLGEVGSGRGVAPPGLMFQAALPRVDGSDSSQGLSQALEDTVGKLGTAWTGPAAPEVKVLPRQLSSRDLPVDPDLAGVPIGVDEVGLSPAHLDLLEDDQHLLVFGDAAGGKSQFLRTWMAAMTRRYSPAQIRFVIFDYRRSLVGAVPDEYVGAYAADSVAAAEYAAQVDERLAERVPPRGITGAALKRRDWWVGPELFLVIDDHDLVGGSPSPLAGLAQRLPHGRDLGFHAVLARRVAGSSRALAMDPFLVRTKEMQPAGLILPGDPREGYLLADHRAGPGVAGRGLLIRRRHQPTVVQIALEED